MWCVAGNGATPPGDMFDALPGYVFLPYTLQKLGYSYHMAWDLGPGDWNEPSKLCATGIKAGRPAIVGLGWLWHYAVAYGYRRQDFKL